MKQMLILTFKYWRRHKKNAFALIFSGTLLCTVLCYILLSVRQEFIRNLHKHYDQEGYFSYMCTDDKQDIIDYLTNEDTIRGEMGVIGEMGIGNFRYTYGTINDTHELAHIPMEAGRLPESENEITVTRAVLNDIGFFGKIGDEITFDTGSYTLVGIIKGNEWNFEDYSSRYGVKQQYEIAHSGDIYNDNPYAPTHWLPVIFVGGDHKNDIQYTWVMLENINGIPPISEDYDYESYEAQHLDNDDPHYKFMTGLIDRFFPDKDDAYYYLDESPEIAGIFNAKEMNALTTYDAIYKYRLYKMMPLFVVCALIAGLSVIAVIRIIFDERSSTMQMLRRIGVSKRRLSVIYISEYLVFAVIQAVIGIALACVTHLCVNRFEVSVLEKSPYSAFTKNEYAHFTPSPFIWSMLTAAGVLLLGVVTALIFSKIKLPSRKSKKASRLYFCISRVLRNRAVTVIQVISLSLICFGTIYGYMLYKHTTGQYVNDDSGNTENVGEFKPYLNYQFGDKSQFDLREEDILEYYSTDGAPEAGVNNFTMNMRATSLNGIDDSTADKLENCYIKGRILSSFVAYKDNDKLKGEINLGNTDGRKFVSDNSSGDGKALVESGKKLYQMPTAICDRQTVDKISKYVISGEIDIDRINSGKEMILVSRYGEPPFSVGESLELYQAVTDNGFGITELLSGDIKIGAVVKYDSDIDSMLKYCVAAGAVDYNLLTTSTGAENAGLYGTNYTEIMARSPIGSKLPLGTGFNVISEEKQKHDIFIQNAELYASMGLLVLIMSLLGFSAYFNGIGMKIRLKEYQLSVMRAVGTPLKKLRRRLNFEGIKIPVFAAAIAYGGIRLMQKIMLDANVRINEMYAKEREDFQKLVDMSNGGYTNEEINEFSEYINHNQHEQWLLERKYLIEYTMWFIDALKPTIIILSIMCIVTIVLTYFKTRRLSGNIALTLSLSRKRRG